MKKLNSLGLGILLSIFLANSLNSNDFNNLKSKFANKLNGVTNNISEQFYMLTKMVTSSQTNALSDDQYDQSILDKLSEIEQEIQKTNAEDVAKIILDEIKNGGNKDE